MLTVVLVLLVATSALAAPSLSVGLVPINEVARPYDSGVGFNRALCELLWEMVDNADMCMYMNVLKTSVCDLASQPNSNSQAMALSQTVAALGELGNGVPGDACAASSAINAYARGGDPTKYTYTLSKGIDTIAKLGTSPKSLRTTAGPTGNCSGGGRTYQFEAAWDRILDAASPYNIAMVNEMYCSVNRLYRAFNVRSNNVGAAVTAASLRPIVEKVQIALPKLVNVLRASCAGSVTSAQVADAKKCLY